MQLSELKDESKKECTAMTVMGPNLNPFIWRPGLLCRGNTHPIIDRVVSPISSEYQERLLKEIMDDSKGG